MGQGAPSWRRYKLSAAAPTITLALATPETGVSFQIKTSDAGKTIGVDTLAIFILDLGDGALVEGTDWVHDVGGGDLTLDANWGDATDPTITFTPSANSDWLVMSSSQIDPVNNSE